MKITKMLGTKTLHSKITREHRAAQGDNAVRGQVMAATAAMVKSLLEEWDPDEDVKVHVVVVLEKPSDRKPSDRRRANG